jgi:hypothetical protein
VLFFFGCPADPEDPTTPTTPETPAIYTLAELEESLSESPNGSAGNPVAVKVAMNLADYWADILTTIETANKYVALDLSACTMNGTEFDPGTADTGKDKIVSLSLPAAAQTIKDGSAVIEDGEISDVHPTFEHFSALKEIHGSNIESIGDLAFYDCRALETADFPKAIEIGDAAFHSDYDYDYDTFQYNYCSTLKTVSFPEVITIGSGAFAGCVALVKANFPKAITIGDAAFGECFALATVSFPKAKTIGFYAFAECHAALETVSFPEATTIDQQAFYGCESLKTADFPQVITIGNGAFSGCRALKTADFSKLTNIGDRAFAYTGNTPLEIKLGTTAPTINSTGDRIFYGSDDAYNTAGKSVTVKVPSNALSSYDTTWQANFTNGSSITLTIETY